MSGIVYEALHRKRQEIRLLVLEDPPEHQVGEHQAQQPLRCKLIRVSVRLDYRHWILLAVSFLPTPIWWALSRLLRSLESPDYMALSYVWGDPARVCEIEIDGQVAKITRNLSEALRSIQACTSFRVVWADALCINQEDNYEKSWQVQQMGTIYKRAHTVVSWLGSATPQSDLAIKELEDLSEKDDWISASHANASQPRGNLTEAFAEHLEQLVHDEERWHALLEIFKRPYWTRLWIFQELAFARRVHFLCGAKSLKNVHRTLYRIMEWIVGTSRYHLLTNNVSMSHFATISGVHELDFHSWRRDPRMLELLRNLNELQASDARDIVFALLSIASDKYTLRARGVSADYSKPVETVFTDIATAILRYGSVDMLHDAVISPKRPGLPTWVPDWERYQPAATKIEPTLYLAHGRKLKQQHQGLNPTVSSSNLALECYVVDKVLLVGDPYQSQYAASNTPATEFNSWLESTQALIWDHSAYIPTNIEDPETLKADITIRLLLADALEHHPLTSRRIPDDFRKESVIKIYRLLRETTSLASLQAAMSSHDPPEVKTYIDNMSRFYLKRKGARPFRTETGYSCLSVFEDCGIGDLVVIVPGCTVPLLIRKTNTGDISGTNPATLVGEAYVHGIMDGEFFANETRKKQKVVLC